MLSSRHITKIGLITLGHLLLMLWALGLVAPPDNISLMWLPDGYLLAVLLLIRRKLWLPLLVTIVASSIAFELFLTDRPFHLIIQFVLANMIESFGAAYLFTRIVKEPTRFQDFRDLVKFISVCVFLVPSISAVIGAIAVTKNFPGTTLFEVYRTWMMSAGLGILFITPLTLYVVDWLKEYRVSKLKAYLPLFFLTVLEIVIIVLGTFFFSQDSTVYLVFTLFTLPLLMYCSIKYGMFGAMVFSSALVITTIQMTAFGYGPFNAESQTLSLAVIKVQSYMVSFVIVSMFVAVATEKFRQANRALEDSRANLLSYQDRLQLTLKGTSSGTFTHDLITGMMVFDETSLRILNADKHEMQFEEFLQCIHPEDQQQLKEELSYNFDHCIEEVEAYSRIKIDGSERHILGKAILTYDKCKPLKSYGIISDITKLKNTELNLKKAKENAELNQYKLNEAQHLAHIGSWEYIIEPESVQWSEELFNIFELPQAKGAPNYSVQKPLYSENSWEILEKAVDQCINEGESYEIELEIITSKGTKKHIISKGVPKKDAHNKIIGCTGTAQDVTDLVEHKMELSAITLAKQQVEAINEELRAAKDEIEEHKEHLEQRVEERTTALQKSKEELSRLNMLFEDTSTTAKVGGWELDLETGINTFTNQTFDIFELPRGQMPSVEEGIEYYHPDDRKQIKDAIENAIANQQSYQLDVRLITAKNNEIWVHTKGNPIVKDGRVVRVYGSIQDITEMKKLSQEKDSLRRQLELFFENMEDSVCIYDEQLTHLYGNPTLLKKIGCESLDDFVGTTVHDWVEESAANAVDELDLKVLNTNKPSTQFIEYTLLNGRQGIQKSITFVFYDTNNTKYLATIDTELGELFKSQEEVKKLKHAIDQSGSGVLMTDLDGIITYVNERLCDNSGYSKEELLGSNVEILRSGEHNSEYYTNIWTAVQEGKTWTGDIINKKKNGTLYVESMSANPIRDNAGKITGYLSVREDVTELRKINDELNSAHRQLSLATDTAKLGIWHYNIEKDLLTWNDKLYEIYGISKEEFGEEQNSWRERVFAEDLALADLEFAKMIEGKSVYDVEFRVKRPDGKIRYVTASGTPVKDKSGEVISLIGINVDITHIREKDIELADRADRYQFLTNFLPHIFWASDATGGLTFVNQSGLEIMGIDEEQLLVNGWFDVIHPGDIPTVAEKWSTSISEGIPFNNEQRIKTKNGIYEWFKVTASPHFNEKREIDSWVGLSTNIHSEIEYLNKVKETSHKLEETNKTLSSIIDSIPGSVFNCEMDDAYSMNFLSPFIERITGYRQNEIYPVGKVKYNDIIHKDDQKNVRESLEKALQEDHKYIINYRIKCKSGIEKWVMESGQFNQSEGKSTIDGVIIDITSQILAEERLIHAIYNAEDMTRKEISRDLHDGLQQSLIVTKMNLESAIRDARKLPASARKRLDVSYEYLSKSIDESRMISHSLIPKTIKEAGLIKSVERLIQSIPETTLIHFHKNFEHTRFHEDIETGIYRIIQEGLNNIIKHSKAQEAMIQLYAKGNLLSLSIEDDGVGFDSNKALDIDKRFGLVSIRNRASSLHGYCDINSTPGRGTAILIEVPIDLEVEKEASTKDS